MGLKVFLGFISVMAIIILLFIYWFIPIGTIEFGSFNSSYETDNLTENSQFYSNMRFSGLDISYQIYDCSLQKKNDMERAFEIVENLTVLRFREVSFGEDIFITCDNEDKIEGGLFIAGEGGPVNFTKGEKFNVITKGKILLIRDSDCERPNIALHELFHVLGFEHSSNPKDLMYPVSKCKQTISSNMVDQINELYSYPSYPDLAFTNAEAKMNGKYLDVNMTIKNEGLADAGDSKVIIYADGKEVKKIDLAELGIGYSRTISLSNLWIGQINVNEIELFINVNFSELEKNNNRIKMGIKN